MVLVGFNFKVLNHENSESGAVPQLQSSIHQPEPKP